MLKPLKLKFLKYGQNISNNLFQNNTFLCFGKGVFIFFGRRSKQLGSKTVSK